MVSVRVYETPPDPAMVPLRRGHVEMLVVSAAHQRRGLGGSSWPRWSPPGRGPRGRRDGPDRLGRNRAAEAFYERLGYARSSHVLHTRAP